jgi:energy-coupling factor transporter transmembrane protein EcfT
VFAPLQRVLPAIVGDALLMTYRSLFLLLEKFGHVLTAARLRAGLTSSGPVRNAKAATRALGGVLLYSIDLSQRTYDVMHLRGYDGRLVVTARSSASTASQIVIVLLALALSFVAVLWRAGGQTAAAFAWLPLLAGVLCLLVGLVFRLFSSEDAR